LFDIGVVPTSEPYKKRMSHGVILGPDNQRMSKSRGNVIVPDEIMKKYGIEVLRVYLMFMGPFDSTIVWNEKTLVGVQRFLDRFKKYITQSKLINDSSVEIKAIINRMTKEIGSDVNLFKFNTAIAKLMQGLNELSGKEIDIKDKTSLLALIAPFIGDDSQTQWPQIDEKLLIDDKVCLPLAINGKVKGKIEIDRIETEAVVLQKAKKELIKWLDNKKITKEIYIPLKMVNFVVF
jgi:leucyl-tRNA synthetase